jgi:hypothetical protein
MPTFRNTLFHLHKRVGTHEVNFIPTHLWRWNRQSVPKRWHLNFRRRWITQKKAYDIKNMAKVWNPAKVRCLAYLAVYTCSLGYCEFGQMSYSKWWVPQYNDIRELCTTVPCILNRRYWPASRSDHLLTPVPTGQRAGIAQSVQRLATGWTVRGSNPGRDEIFRTRRDRPWDPPRVLYNGYRVFPGGKAAGVWCWPPTPF